LTFERKRPGQSALHLDFRRCILFIVRRTKDRPKLPASKGAIPGSTSDKGAAAEAAEKAPGEGAGGEEIGGPAGPEPTRYGDWERNGRCIDF
jgi:hypothetical protein